MRTEDGHGIEHLTELMNHLGKQKGRNLREEEERLGLGFGLGLRVGHRDSDS